MRLIESSRWTTVFVVGAWILLYPTAGTAQVTVILDSAGDGAGNVLNGPSGVTADANGNVYVTGKLSDNAFRVTPSGSIFEIIDALGDLAGNALSDPRGITTGADGHVYLAALANAFEITPSGTITEIIDSSGDGAGNPFAGGSHVAVHSDGTVYVAGWNDSVFAISPAGTITEVVGRFDPPPPLLLHLTGLALDADKNVYVSTDNGYAVLRVSPVGTLSVAIPFTGAGFSKHLSDPEDVAVDASGNVYVVGGYSDNALKLTPAGTITEIIDASGDGLGNALDQPRGIAVDASERVFVTGSASDNVFMVSPDGAITEIMDASGDGGANVFDFPSSIAADADGNVFVIGSSKVFKVAVGLPVCNDGIDNDSDGLTDFPDDPGCERYASDIENPPCDDGIDNDLDSLTDFGADPGCASGHASLENPQCDDGSDNDLDGLADFANDLECSSASDDSELSFDRNWTGSLGFKIGALPPLVLTGAGVAVFSGPLATPGEMRLSGGVHGIGIAPVTDPELAALVPSFFLEASLGAGTLGPLLGTAAFTQPVVPVRGIMFVCLVVAGCSSNIPLNLTTQTGSTGVGAGGGVITESRPPLRMSLQADAWTLGAATLTTQTANGALATAMQSGFIHSLASSSVLTPLGSIQLISPVQIATTGFPGNHEKIALFTTLTLRFVPEPSALLFLAAGGLTLALLNRKRLRK